MVGEFLHAVSAVFMIFALMAVGFVLGKLGWMDSGDKKFVSRYVVNIAVPMNCVNGILNNFTRDDFKGMGLYLPVPYITILTCLLISFAAGKLLRLPRERFGVFVAMSFLSNALFIGLPLSTQLFGETCVGYVMLYYIGSTTFTQTVCVMLVERSGTAAPQNHSAAALCRDIFTKPPILALLASMCMLFLGVRPPEIVMSFAKYCSNTLTPLALMYCGYIVFELGIRNIRMEKGIPVMLFIRLLVSPAVCALICLLTGVQGLCRSVFIVESALPTVSQITVMAGAYGADEEYSATGAILSMLGIFLTIPVLMVILS
ncbi:MAG: AEC family transporter [Eubacteriales bacterium]|nr:AEC family transporter [Eubacteriales bacterium]